MKTKQNWEFLGSWPADGLQAERSGYVFTWRSRTYTIAGSIKGDGAPTFNIYQWGAHGKNELIEYGFTTLHRAKGFVDRYHAGLDPAIQQ